ncbi:hypothetical protein ACFE04_002412 [Oxalis oulophora]
MTWSKVERWTQLGQRTCQLVVAGTEDSAGRYWPEDISLQSQARSEKEEGNPTAHMEFEMITQNPCWLKLEPWRVLTSNSSKLTQSLLSNFVFRETITYGSLCILTNCYRLNSLFSSSYESGILVARLQNKNHRK